MAIQQVYQYAKLRLQSLSKDEEGATMIEYGLLVALIAVVLIGVITLLGEGLDGIFGEAKDAIDEAGSE